MRALLLLALWPALAAGQPVEVDDVVAVYVLKDGRQVGIEETTEPPRAEGRRPWAVELQRLELQLERQRLELQRLELQLENRRPAPARQVPAPVAAAARAAPVVVRVPVAAPEVAQASAPSFRAAATGPVSHAGHNCPRCGTSQYNIAARYPDGSHLHTCPRCGQSWRHQ